MDTRTQGIEGKPNEEHLLILMEKTGYSMIQENGQRKYGGPPPNWEGPAPPKGCEIFVGKIPRDIFEDELVPVFEQVGKIYEMRLMMDFSGTNRGYAFVMYTNRNDALTAVKDLNNHEVRKDRYLGVCMSVDNCRLFVGGIPKTAAKEEILKEMRKVTDGVVDVIVYPSAPDKSKNRGFAFVEYESHRSAAMARRKLIPGKIHLFNNQIAVDWAEPEREVEDEVMDKVRILYMRNLMLTTTDETIRKACNRVLANEDAVERVKKIKDYAFVHFKDRKDALQVKDALNNTALDNSNIEVSLAKPVDKTDCRHSRAMGTRPNMLTQEYYTALYHQQQQYNMYAGAPFMPHQQQAAMTANSATAGFTPRGEGVGRGGFVPRGGMMQRGRGRGAAGSRAASARGAYNSGYMRGGYKKPSEERLYDLQPGMELTPINPITLKPQAKSSPQILDEWCATRGLGAPIFQLHSTLSRDSSSGEQVQLFLYKVSIPALMNQYPHQPFTPGKLSRCPDEAKVIAAEHTLAQLGVPVDMMSQAMSSLSVSEVTGAPAHPAGRPVYPDTHTHEYATLTTYATTIPTVASTAGTYGKVPIPQMPGEGFHPQNFADHPPMFYASPVPSMHPHQHQHETWISG
ncbi:APOBEC1 complementation factor-like isoform X2 [Lineus longissimus]|uniref:APOBEC1 complementation factor-like isoform X2 n=1 Tax=Lineus longissimus TaxID=88925 RepID=UPI00315C5E7F